MALRCCHCGLFDLVARILQIPASIEEVIETVTTAKPTVTQYKRKIGGNSAKSGLKSRLFDLKKKAKFTFNQRFPQNKHIKQSFVDKNVKRHPVQKAQIITGKGLSVPVFDGEQIVS